MRPKIGHDRARMDGKFEGKDGGSIYGDGFGWSDNKTRGHWPKDLLPWRGISSRSFVYIRLISRLLKCTPPLPDSLDLFLRLLERGRDTFAIGTYIYIYIYSLIKRACSSWHAAITATKIRYRISACTNHPRY